MNYGGFYSRIVENHMLNESTYPKCRCCGISLNGDYDYCSRCEEAINGTGKGKTTDEGEL